MTAERREILIEEISAKALASTNDEATLRKLEDVTVGMHKNLSDGARVKRELQQMKQSENVSASTSMQKPLSCIVGSLGMTGGKSLMLATYSDDTASSRTTLGI